ncbi:MAG: DUF6261 family protein [Tannerellaceae bacterium]|jgi:hypothetical protein|nr:DUF6261 family protein [Tannerellaceae bacterium]
MKVIRIPIRNLHNEELFNLLVELRDLIERFDAGKIGIEKLFLQLLVLLDKADKLLIVLRKSVYTKDIEAADKKRDKLVRGLINLVKAMQNQPSAAMQKAAERLFNLLREYREPILRGTYVEESAALYNLLEDLRTKYTADVTALQLTTWVTAIDQAEQEFLTLWAGRKDESVAKPKEELTQVYAQIEILYNAIITQLDITLLADGLGGDFAADPESLDTDDHDDNKPFAPETHGNIVYNFVLDLNETIKKYRNLLQYRAGRRSKNPDNETEEF